MTAGSTPTESASTGELITQMAAQTSRLVRDEIRLAQKEFQESAKHAGIGAGLFSVAGVFAVFGVATLIAAAVAALALVLPVWAAALIVGRRVARRRRDRRTDGQATGARGVAGTATDGGERKGRHPRSEGRQP